MLKERFFLHAVLSDKVKVIIDHARRNHYFSTIGNLGLEESIIRCYNGREQWSGAL